MPATPGPGCPTMADAPLPVAEPWYRVERLDARLTRITEPHVHPIFSANIHLVTGRDADLLIDSGMGVAPLRPLVDRLRPDPARPLICLTTHAHVDHMGAAHEFDIRLVHPLEAEDLADPAPWTLQASSVPRAFVAAFAQAGCSALRPLLIDALPAPGWDPAAWRLRGADPTGTVEDGATLDLGDARFEVLHLPGHSRGQVGLWEPATGLLFAADAAYDGPLIADGPGMDRATFSRTLHRLRALPVTRVHGGHDPDFDRARLHTVIDAHLALWDQ